MKMSPLLFSDAGDVLFSVTSAITNLAFNLIDEADAKAAGGGRLGAEHIVEPLRTDSVHRADRHNAALLTARGDA